MIKFTAIDTETRVVCKEYLSKQKFFGFEVMRGENNVKLYIQGDGGVCWLIAVVSSEFIANDIISKVCDKLEYGGIIDIDKVIVGRVG